MKLVRWVDWMDRSVVYSIKDIIVGTARVPWAHRTRQPPRVLPDEGSQWLSPGWLDSGWALPGGQRTDDRDLATHIARQIHQAITNGRSRHH